MRLTLVLNTVVLVLLSASAWAANPFSPPEEVQLFYQVVYPDDKQVQIEYKMYMQRGQKITALLNDTFVAEGDTYKEMKVISINDKRVVLISASGEKRIIVIDAMQSKLEQLRKILNKESQ